MSESRIEIDLSEFRDLGILLKLPSGATYTSQVAGHGCLHPRIEGVFVPLVTPIGRSELAALSGRFRGSWHPIGSDEVHFLNYFFARFGLNGVSVDESQLAQSYEAWVHVVIAPNAISAVLPLASGTEPRPAVFIWPNSD